jgi:hypothetical protein
VAAVVELDHKNIFSIMAKMKSYMKWQFFIFLQIQIMGKKFSSKNVLEHSQPLSLLSLMMILLPTFKSPNAVFC